MYEFECARRVMEIYARTCGARKICDLFLRSKARCMRRGQKRSRLHISVFLTCCSDVAGGRGGGGIGIGQKQPLRAVWCKTRLLTTIVVVDSISLAICPVVQIQHKAYASA